MIKELEQLLFDNQFTRELPADPDASNERRQVMAACYSYVNPSKVSAPTLVAYAREVAQELDLSAETCESQDFAEVFAGNKLLAGMEPYACCYGGAQFGQWAGQLGDGRVINLGEIVNKAGKRWVVQLKGAGATPYSRSADGLAVLRSSVREFLCSEAMYHLGVPTTRALSLVLTGEHVMRDMFYNGNAKAELGAVVCRVAPSFIRFGSFQLFAARGELTELKQLLDYTIKTDFPHLLEQGQALDKVVYLKWFEDVCQKTANMIVHWQRVGFVHGVMNTDNMSILGLTIDYGPYGWLDNYDPDWTPNTTDSGHRRYRFGQQSYIAYWNLLQLANAIYPLVEQVDPFQAALSNYNKTFNKNYHAMMLNKIGLKENRADADASLIEELLSLLAEAEVDMTIFYRKLANIDSEQNADQQSDEQLIEPLLSAWYRFEAINGDYQSRFAMWLRLYIKRLQSESSVQVARQKAMNMVNPKYVLRNYLAQQAIEKAEQGDYSLVDELLEVMRHPYDEQPDKEELAQKRPEWARNKPGCSSLSCSS